ncbi:MAG: hypothetical protein ACT4PV_06270 [Planctomycetaceae bacterium]
MRVPSPLPLLLLACSCASSPDAREQVEARRPEVLEALYRQLELVLHRQEELASRTDHGVEEERREMSLLAAGIALRIARIDPDDGKGRLAAMIGRGDGRPAEGRPVDGPPAEGPPAEGRQAE